MNNAKEVEYTKTPYQIGTMFENSSGKKVVVGKANSKGEPRLTTVGAGNSSKFYKNSKELQSALNKGGYKLTKDATKQNLNHLLNTRIENAYKRYIKEHPNSKMKLSDFRDEWKRK